MSIAALESGFSVSERYADLVQCEDQTLLITRLQPDLHAFEWMTVVRTWKNDKAQLLLYNKLKMKFQKDPNLDAHETDVERKLKESYVGRCAGGVSRCSSKSRHVCVLQSHVQSAVAVLPSGTLSGWPGAANGRPVVGMN